MLLKMIIASDKKMLFLRLLIATLVLLDLFYAKLYFPESDTYFDLFQLRFLVSLLLTGVFVATFFVDGRSLLLIVITTFGLVVNTAFDLYLLHIHNFHYANISEFLFTILVS